MRLSISTEFGMMPKIGTILFTIKQENDTIQRSINLWSGLPFVSIKNTHIAAIKDKPFEHHANPPPEQTPHPAESIFR